MKRVSRESGRKALIAILIVLAISLITSIVALMSSSHDSILSTAISAFETIGLLISAIIAVKQLNDSKSIAHATFITELNNSFVGNSDYIDVYNKLQGCLDQCCCSQSKCSDRLNIEVPCNVFLSKGQISNYLTFFETIYILLRRNVIDFDVLDDLFAYRFFLAIHSKVVQQQKIKLQPQNFRNIFCLEHEWLAYRKKIGKYTEGENTVYGNLLLRNLVDDSLYENLTEGCRENI